MWDAAVGLSSQDSLNGGDSDCNTKAEKPCPFPHYSIQGVTEKAGDNMETWKAVKGYEGLYEVSDEGRVRSLDHQTLIKRGKDTYYLPVKGRVMTPQERRHGYLAVCLYGRGGNKSGFRQISVHRLVAEAFLENPNGYTEVNHKDENKQNNRLDNLEWCDRKYNINYGNAQNKRADKTRNNSRSRAIAQYDLNGNLLKIYPSLGEVFRQTGFSQSNIWNFASGKTNNRHQYGYVWKFADTK